MRRLLFVLVLVGCATEPSQEKVEAEDARPYAPRLSINMIGVHGCNAFADGIDLGMTPIFLREMTAGTHLLAIRCPDGRHLEQNITLALGTEHKYSFRPDELHIER